jgi:hypothetical protein
MKDKPKTGLGSSLLLQRTDKRKRSPARDGKTPEAPKSSGRPDASDHGATPKPAEPIKRPEPVVLPRQRCTLYLDEDVNEQLSLTAGIENKQRSEIVTEILRRHLPTYTIERVNQNQPTDTAA